MPVPKLTTGLIRTGTIPRIHFTFAIVPVTTFHRLLIASRLELETERLHMGIQILLETATAFAAKISCRIQDRLLRRKQL